MTWMMLYFIGLGLGDAKDISVKGLEIIKTCERVYLESYTSILTCGKKQLEEFYDREVVLADRDLVEQGSDTILDEATSTDVAFLVVGDPFGATTHSDLVLRARERGISTRFVHNASIINAVGCCGLQLYKFGETISIPFWTDEWKPESFYDKIALNLERDFHTLCLLDIKVKEQTVENMMRGRKIYEPPRFMTTQQAAEQLMSIARRRQSAKTDTKSLPIDHSTPCILIARVGADDQKLIYCTLGEAAEATLDMGGPLHSIVVPSKELHEIELESVNWLRLRPDQS